jgi:NADPH2:quinone reductase
MERSSHAACPAPHCVNNIKSGEWVRAVICKEFGPIENLAVEEIADPSPGSGEVLIDIRAAGVNFPDGLMVRGEYQMKPDRPFTPGNEVAGVISAVGPGVTTLSVGQRVVALCGLGGFAEKVVAPADRALAIPDGMDFATAGGFMLVYGTSMHALADKARIKPGETLLVLGAAGGVGLAAVEIGAAMGMRVVAAASTDDKLALARAHGAEIGINYATADLKTELKRLVPGGVDVVYDPVGGSLTEAAVRGMAWGGRLLIIGFANGEIPKLALNLLLLREGEAIGVFWGSFTQRFPARHAENTAQLMRWFEEGKLRPHVGATYGLAHVKDALADVMGRRAHGKIVLTA